MDGVWNAPGGIVDKFGSFSSIPWVLLVLITFLVRCRYNQVQSGVRYGIKSGLRNIVMICKSYMSREALSCFT